MAAASRRTAARLLFALALMAPLLAWLPAPVATAASLGSWSVTDLAGDSWRISWRSPTRLPIISARPAIVASGRSLGTATIAADGRTVSVVVHASSRPSTADLHVSMSGDRLDVPGRDRVTAASISAGGLQPGRDLLSGDPATRGSYPVVTSDYQRSPITVPGLSTPVEFVGHVVEPALDADTGPRPLVLFLHGRHSYCYGPSSSSDDPAWPCQSPQHEVPSQLGYDYIQQVLASQGYTTVSIRANGINAQDDDLADGGAAARAALITAQLDYWTTLATSHHVDLSKVVLVGHSRGGEGVDRASLRIPLSAPYRIVGQVLIAPTDFAGQVADYVPTVTLLPYCDGDVSDLEGQGYIDAGRDLAGDDTALRSAVLVMGANHNFFNTEWTPGLSAAPSVDDWSGDAGAVCGTSSATRLSATAQRSVGLAYVDAAVQLFASGAEKYLPLFDGSSARVASTGSAVALSAAIGGGRTMRRPDTNTGLALATATTQFCSGVLQAGGPHSYCGRDPGEWSDSPHWSWPNSVLPVRKAFEMSWTASGQVGGLLLTTPLDLTDRRLELRTIVDPAVNSVDLRVRLTDAAGATATLTPLGGTRLYALPVDDLGGHRWAQAMLVDPATAGIDLSRISRVDLVSVSGRGRVWLLDIAAAGSTLTAVPATRLPLVSLGSATVTEGDSTTPRTAQVPFTVTGDVTSRARLLARLEPISSSDRASTVTINLSPGQTTGSVPIDYVGNLTHEDTARGFFIRAWGYRDAMTDVSVGSLTIKDDDPEHLIVVKPQHGTIAEGRDAVWTVRLGKPLDADATWSAEFVRGPAKVRPLDGRDVGASWLKRHQSYAEARSVPMYRQPIVLSGVIPAGQTRASIPVPIIDDHKREGREQLTLRLYLDDMSDDSITSTIYVKASK